VRSVDAEHAGPTLVRAAAISVRLRARLRSVRGKAPANREGATDAPAQCVPHPGCSGTLWDRMRLQRRCFENVLHPGTWRTGTMQSVLLRMWIFVGLHAGMVLGVLALL
jgi:hypothetical protein